jgi:Rrf2 family cysteine metabolism transcriptional repressor
MISLKSQYGLKAVVSLAGNKGKGHMQAKEIAAEQGVPVRYLELLLSHLRRARMVDATRGKNGGYVLAREPQDISVWDVVSIFEGKNIFGQLEAGSNGSKGDQVYGLVWKEAEKRMINYLASIKISDLLESISTGKEMYFI